MTNDEYRQNNPPQDTPPHDNTSREVPPQNSGTQTPPPQRQDPQKDGGSDQQPRTSSSSRPRTSTKSTKKPSDDRVHSSTADPAARSGGKRSETNADARSKNTRGSGSSSQKPKKEKIDLQAPRSTRPAHKVLPYIFLALAFFVAVCLVSNLIFRTANKGDPAVLSTPSAHPMGSVGYYLCYGLFGMFGPAVFALPVLLLNMAYFWKAYLDNKLVAEKSIGSFVLLILISAMIHVFCLAALKESERQISAKMLIEYGAQMTGGGLIGGGIGYFFVKYLNVAGGIIVSIFLTLLAAFFFLGMTPQHLLERIRTKRNLKKAERVPLGVDDEEYIYEQMEKKHARAAGRTPDPAPKTHVTETEPPKGAVRVVNSTSVHTPHKKSDDGLAPMPMPILDATDDTPADSPLYVPEEVGKDLQNSAGTAKAPAAAEQNAAAPRQEQAAAVPPHTVAAQTAKPQAAGSAVPARPAPASARQADSIDPIFPRNVSDAKSQRKVQKSDRNFELGSIFINLDDHDAPEVRRHAPLPPEVPMPGSASRQGSAAGNAPATRQPAQSAAQQPARPAPAGARPVPAPQRNAAQAGATRPSGTGAPAAKPIYRPAEKTGQTDFGLSNEEFEQREAASQSISRAMAAKSAGNAGTQAKPATAKPTPAAQKNDTPKTASTAAPEKPQPYVFPPISYLHPGEPMTAENQAEIETNMNKLYATLSDFNVRIKEITYSCGPTVTRYEIFPDAGVRVKNIINLADDIALSFAVQGVRMEPIAGKSAIGVEVPNTTRCTVYLRDLLESRSFTENPSRLTAGLGADVTGTPLLFDISKMPHLLVAGTTGSGKSICINCIIMSILFKARPDEVKLILIDPKKVEFSLYKGIPHLMAPIIITPKDAAGALQAAVNEMEDRFSKIQDVGVHDIAGYNKAAAKDPDLAPMPHIVIIIDELADLMMTARDEVEDSICRLAQKARAAGMHIIIGTQRPSVDVVTGLIKSNIPSRIACTVRSQVDSRTILDFAGAEKLLGRGDMLFAPIGSMKPTRVQGAFVSDGEVEKICEFIRATNGTANYNENFTSKMKEFSAQCGNKKGKGDGGDAVLPGGEGGDNKYVEAIRVAIEEKRVSTSLLQRKLGIGYSRAAKIIDRMEEEGLVSKPDGAKPRSILISAEQFIERYVEGDAGEGVDI